MYRNNDSTQPDSLDLILELRPEGASTEKKPVDHLRDRIKGAVIGRCAGCVLGVPVENYKPLDTLDLAIRTGTEFPPLNYWRGVNNPDNIQYGVNKRSDYTLSGIHSVPVDDDITYTMLNLILLEKYGKNYTVEDVGAFWLDVLPYACTAEDEALRQLQAGTHAKFAANFNTSVELIGAAIRADAFGYAEAGNPEAAAKLSYADAYLTHRKNGIYGEMFCAAAIAAAFTAATPLDACREGMKQMPKESELYKALEWAFSCEGTFQTYAKARALIDEKFPRMHMVHTINNMCALVFGLMLGGNDFTKCISQTVAIGLDNDCTGATAGSIAGACLGFDAIPTYWYENFNDTIGTYIKGHTKLSIEDVTDRFVKLNG